MEQVVYGFLSLVFLVAFIWFVREYVRDKAKDPEAPWRWFAYVAIVCAFGAAVFFGGLAFGFFELSGGV